MSVRFLTIFGLNCKGLESHSGSGEAPPHPLKQREAADELMKLDPDRYAQLPAENTVLGG